MNRPHPTRFPDLNKLLDELRLPDSRPRPHHRGTGGGREMQWSTHCNTEVVRWSLRERGVTLAAPDPETLVDPVSPDILRAKAREYARTFLPGLLSWISLDVEWAQRYAVATLCRILQTLDEGRVTSKRAALLWARDHVDPQWSGLIRRALDDRELGWDPDRPPRPGSVAQTLAFADYVERRAGGDVRPSPVGLTG